jgi:hypothetical protein
MSSKRCNAVSLLICAGALLCASTAFPQNSGSEVTRTSRPVRLLRSWGETLKASGGREFQRRVDLVIDYSRGIASEISYTPDGRVYKTREIRQNLPVPSVEEIAEAKQLLLSDPGIAKIVARFSAVLEGGFVVEEANGLPCGPGSRCLQIQILSPDRSGLIRWTVVDLARLKLAYPVYMPGGAR